MKTGIQTQTPQAKKVVDLIMSHTMCDYIGCEQDGQVVLDTEHGIRKLCEECYELVLSSIADIERD